ncbi:MAG: type II toxin-antitoxin system Phd/YefM family antitoxin [Patescibacteria group bacterium]
MRAVSTFDFRADLSRYLEDVAATQMPLVIHRFGKPIVVVKPYTKDVDLPVTRFFGFMGSGETGDAYVNRVRRSPTEKRKIARFRNRT